MKKVFLFTLAMAGFMTAVNAQDQRAGCEEASYQFTNNLNDLSGQSVDLTPQGEPVYGTDRFGQASSAFSFNGSTYLKSKPLNTSSWQGSSYSFWCKPSHHRKSRGSIINLNGNSVFLNAYSEGKVSACFDGDLNNNANTDECGTSVYSERWYHIACTNDGQKTRIYVNGQLENTYNEAFNTNPSGSILIGGLENGTEFYEGLVDDVHVFSCVLTAPEVGQLYAQEVLAVENFNVPIINFSLYPNPNSGDATIIETENLSTVSELCVTDATGRLVEQFIIPAGSHKSSLNISGLPAGIYMVQLKTAEGMSTKKLMIE